LALFAHRATAAPVVPAVTGRLRANVSSAKQCQRLREHPIDSIGVSSRRERSSRSSVFGAERNASAALAFKGDAYGCPETSAKAKVETTMGDCWMPRLVSPLDIISLHAATGAPDIRFDLVII